MKRNLLSIFFVIFTLIASAQSNDIKSVKLDTVLQVDYATNLDSLVAYFIESGVTISNVQSTGAFRALGSFSGGLGCELGIEKGIILSSGNVKLAIGPNNSGNAGSSNGTAGNPDLNTLSGLTTFDASILEFDLIPEGNVLAFNYVFGSEEYPEYVNQFNDAFGFFLSGPGINGTYSNNAINIALIPGTDSAVSINNINPNVNSEYYISNNQDYLQYDGYTTVLPILINVTPFETYHLKMVIGDCIDRAFDSGVFLESPSLKSYTVIAVEDVDESYNLQLYPNPLTEKSTLSYTLKKQESVSVEVFDLSGKKIASLLNEKQSAGQHTVSLTGLEEEGMFILRFLCESGSRCLKVVK